MHRKKIDTETFKIALQKLDIETFKKASLSET
jgi:hypothetical protein